MPTFRAYLLDQAGAITWAAWVDGAHLAEAQRKAHELCGVATPTVELCGVATPTVELWSATDRLPNDTHELDPV